MIRSMLIAWPLTIGFFFCLFKGSTADNLTQRVVERREVFSWPRNFGFATFSACYTGIFQGVLYNYTFDYVFGRGNSWPVVLKKAVWDGMVHTPLLYMPAAYYCNNYLTGKMPPMEAVRTYFTKEEFLSSGLISIAVWFPAQVVIFMFPPYVRVYVNGSLGLIWQTALATMSYLGDREPLAADVEDSSL